jgi:hypothetical protein
VGTVADALTLAAPYTFGTNNWIYLEWETNGRCAAHPQVILVTEHDAAAVAVIAAAAAAAGTTAAAAAATAATAAGTTTAATTVRAASCYTANVRFFNYCGTLETPVQPVHSQLMDCANPRASSDATRQQIFTRQTGPIAGPQCLGRPLTTSNFTWSALSRMNTAAPGVCHSYPSYSRSANRMVDRSFMVVSRGTVSGALTCPLGVGGQASASPSPLASPSPAVCPNPLPAVSSVADYWRQHVFSGTHIVYLEWSGHSCTSHPSSIIVAQHQPGSPCIRFTSRNYDDCGALDVNTHGSHPPGSHSHTAHAFPQCMRCSVQT